MKLTAVLIDRDLVEIVLGSFRVVAGLVISPRMWTDKLYNTIRNCLSTNLQS